MAAAVPDGQYANTDNLNARIAIYAFAPTPTNWRGRLFDLLAPLEGRQILEVGAGHGLLWRHNLARLPADAKVHCTDISAGMAAALAAELADRDSRITALVADAAALPFPAASFDVAIANHMLYHVADLRAVLAELHGLLRPGGRLFASTNSRRHLQELKTLARSVYPNWGDGMSDDRFRLEDGPAAIGEHFTDISVDTLDGVLNVTEPAPILAYINSVPPASTNPGIRQAGDRDLSRRLDRHIGEEGSFRITTANGLIRARKR